ncbi:DUF1534 domain-containing protein [Pseudomonas syringae]|nr:DUF1534 domain-containing protein [Pseudomonas syringae]MCF5475596.1 DUF1534 domain-containing protein [Pseudomonas syringae]MCF5485488.1 DUF1534 domain-containing protein [Pseudomonas syringae]MCF5489914.1 DUF1534 domain-containing protein [Pseudomonas syringae]MCF5527265.1 DUF1534 domain-containing protein [Pseudomonas syringae]
MLSLSFRTLQRGNAVRDALRRKEDAERRTIVGIIVPYAPAWERISRRSASQRGRGASRTACRRVASHDS